MEVRMFAKFVTRISGEKTTKALESLNGVYTVNEIRELCKVNNCKAVCFDEQSRRVAVVYQNGQLDGTW